MREADELSSPDIEERRGWSESFSPGKNRETFSGVFVQESENLNVGMESLSQTYERKHKFPREQQKGEVKK